MRRVGLRGRRSAAERDKRGSRRETHGFHVDLPSLIGGRASERPCPTVSTPASGRTSIGRANASISRSKRRRAPARRPALPQREAAPRQRWQAVAWSPSATSAGRSTRQRSIACGQRRCRWQPGGGLIGLGTSPCRMVRSRCARGRGTGIADEQRLRVGVARVREQLIGRRGLDDAAEIHHGDAVGDVLHHREIVRDEDVGEARAAAAGRAAG